jgi:hypothetical protein
MVPAMAQQTEAPGGRLARLFDAVELFRPRTLARLGKTDEKLQQQVDALFAEIRTLKTELNQANVRERQLRAVLKAECGSDDSRVVHFEAALRDAGIEQHVGASIGKASLHLDPFPHCVVDHLLPDWYYDALIAALPPADLFADRPENKQQLTVPLEFGPSYSMRVWDHMAAVVTEEAIMPAVLAKFHKPLTKWLQDVLPVLGSDPLAQLLIHCSNGRILLRRRGYRIPPHRDPKWGFITCLMYLARKKDDQRWGTQLFAVDGDTEAVGPKPHWISHSQCRLVRDIAFRPNRALIFLNSAGAHGAEIPADAEPADLERYALQFRIGPDRRSMETVVAQLPPEQHAFWGGKGGDY